MSNLFETDKKLISLKPIFFIISCVLIFTFFHFTFDGDLFSIAYFIILAIYLGFFSYLGMLALDIIALMLFFKNKDYAIFMDDKVIKECVGKFIVNKYKFRKIKSAELYRYDAIDGSAYTLKLIYRKNKSEILTLTKKNHIPEFCDEFWKRTGIQLKEHVIKDIHEYTNLLSK